MRFRGLKFSLAKSVVAAGAALVAVGVSAGGAFATSVEALSDLNMRAGPGTNYEKVTVLPAGVRVGLGSCSDDLQWCQVTYGNTQGWASSHYLGQPTDAPPDQPRIARVAPQQERIIRREPRYEREYDTPPLHAERQPLVEDQQIRRRRYADPQDEYLGPADDHDAQPRVYFQYRVVPAYRVYRYNNQHRHQQRVYRYGY